MQRQHGTSERAPGVLFPAELNASFSFAATASTAIPTNPLFIIFSLRHPTLKTKWVDFLFVTQEYAFFIFNYSMIA